MSILDNFFKVKVGLGVGTDTLYANAVDKNVAIGDTDADYKLDVYGTVYGDEDLLVSRDVGIGTTVPLQELDVRGVGIFSTGVGIGTTNPLQLLQVSSGSSVIVATESGNFGIGVTNPIQKFQVNEDNNGVYINDEGFIGFRVEEPTKDFEFRSSSSGTEIVITGEGLVGINTAEPEFDLDINGELRVGFATITNEFVGVSTIGFATITDAFIGVATVGFATITNEFVGVSTIGFATITDAFIGVATVGFATITNEFVGVSTIGFATITDSFIGVATVGFATITDAFIGVATVGFATITNEFVGVSTIGFATITNEFVGVSTIGFATITDAFIGVATVGFATITNEFVGVSTIGFATITDAFIGVGTVGFATITDAFIGVGTVGFATITDAFIGVSTIGFATITDAFIGVATVGFATITNEFVGVSTIGFATITDAFIGVGTVGFATITDAFIGVGTVGFATITDAFIGVATISREDVIDSEIDNLLVTGITTTNKLDVGIGATLAKFESLGVTSVFGLDGNLVKNIEPIVGIGTTIPTRTLDIAGDLRVRGEVLDANNHVGYAFSVLSSKGSPGITDRFFDAANLLVRNKEFITEEIVGFITSTDGLFGISGPNFDYGPVGVETGRAKCKRDLGIIIDAIAFDITRGGNSQSVGAGVSYTLGNFLESSDPPPSGLAGFPGGYVKFATLAGISSLSYYAQFVVNNATPPRSFQTGISTVVQLKDLTITADGDSNQNPAGCANVVSAIHTAVGIVSTIVDNNGLDGTGISTNSPAGELEWKAPGPLIGNEYFVNKFGNDLNEGDSPGNAFLTIKKAASVAQPGDTIKVFAGLYIEDGPISLNERVAVVGEDLRRTLVSTRHKTDLYYIKRGCYVAEQSFVGESNPGKAMISFPTQGFGFADGTEENWQSPYVQNCTNFVPDSIGMRIDGNRAGGFKSMVLDAYTQYNQGGIGVSITNFGYAQLVSLFTICCDTAVFCDSGGVCDLNNSNSSFGNFGLVSNGATPLQYVAEVTAVPDVDNIDTLTINVGAGASQEFIDSVSLLRSNKDFIASEVVGFLTSTDGPFGANGPNFDYGGSSKGRELCRRDSKIIVEKIASDILTLGNGNSIEAGLSYRDSPDGSLTYLGEKSTRPVGFDTGYVKDAEIAAIEHIAGISTFIVQNISVPDQYQTGVGTFPQVTDNTKLYSPLINDFIVNRAGIITSIIGIGTDAAPALILPKGQRPYDGQISIIETQYFFVSSIKITDGGSGYDPNVPIEVVIDLPPDPNFFVPAQAVVVPENISSGIGSITEIDVIVSGTGYETGGDHPAITISAPPDPNGTTATAEVVLEKLFFRPTGSTPVSAGGTTNITFDEFITYPVSIGNTIQFFQSSKIIASSITFEYIGTGINIVNAIPSKGAVPIVENEIVATNGGQVPFTSTDQGGNFKISEGITINQNTGTIRGQAFSKSLQAEVTPLIIALQQ